MTSDKATHNYRVEAVRSGNWWSITVPELSGVFSQAKRLDQVETSAREAIAMMLDIAEAEVGPLEVDVTPPATVVEVLKRLEDFVATANEATDAATAARREAAQLLPRRRPSHTRRGRAHWRVPPARQPDPRQLGVADCAQSDG